MSHIYVNFREVRQDNKEINILANKLNRIERDLDNIRFWISRKIKNWNGIEARLDSAIKSIDQLEKQLRTLYAFIEESLEAYENAEKKINAVKLDGVDEKSWWEKLGDIADVVGDSIKGFALGAKDAVVSTWDGLVYVVNNPKETIDGLVYVIQNPGEALSATWDAIVESWNTQVINGDAESRGKFFGRAFGEVALAVVGTKGVDKAVKAAKGTKIVQEASKGYKVIKSDVANKVGNVKVPVRVTQEVVVTPDGSKFSTWNVETKPVRELYQKFAAKGTGKVYPTRQIDLVEEAHIIDRVKELRGNLPSKYKTSGNFALAEVSIEGLNKKEFYASSRIDELKGSLTERASDISIKPNNPVFEATEAPNEVGEFYLRDSDTEYKILNDIGSRLGGNTGVTGKIKLFTELDTCNSCSRVIAEFSNKYRNIDLEVIHNNGERVKP